MEGFEALPLSLAAKFQAAGAKSSCGTVVPLDRDLSEGSIRLVFDQGPATGAVSGRRITGQEVVCHARHVILAMPRR